MTRRVRILVLVSTLTAALITTTAVLTRHHHTSTGTAPRHVALDEMANGHTINVAPGATIDVVLHSTYWSFVQPADRGVLKADRPPTVTASSGCVPGSGCGTVTATFTAPGTGTVAIQATRTSCGEAMTCRPDQASFTVTIIIGNGSTTSPPAPSEAPTPATLTATEADNQRTVTLAVGDHLTVVLASIYWHFTTLAAGVLTSPGPATVTATPPGQGCVPGAGCGTVTMRYTATATGQTTIAADRTTCGEALRCTGSRGTYRLHVVVR
jgi:hypothetical protein